MATLYYGNNSVMDLHVETLAALRRLPSSWDVILNLRPVTGQTARELDAVVLTGRAVHVLEFKRRRAPIQIVTESRWLCEGHEIRNSVLGGESPAEQVRNSAEAFKESLKVHFPRLRDRVLPCVVLERFNPQSRKGTPADFMPQDRWHEVGWAKVIHGLRDLETLLKRREENLTADISDADRRNFRRHFGAKPLGELTVQGHALLLDSHTRLQHTTLRFTTVSTGQVAEVTTDANGGFELQGLPMEPIEVTVPDLPDLRVLPGSTFKANTELLIMHVFLVGPQVSEAQVREWLERELGQVRQDVEAVLDLAGDAGEKVARLDQQVAEMQRTIDTLLTVPNADDNSTLMATVDGLVEKLEALERQRRQVDAAAFLDADLVRRDALGPLEAHLSVLDERLSAVESRLGTVAATAAQAQRDASGAYRRAQDLTVKVDDVVERVQTAERTSEEAGQQARGAYRKAEHLEFRVERVYDTARTAHTTAERAEQQAGHAARQAQASATSATHAAQASSQSAQEAAFSREAQEGLLALERTKYLTEEERRAKRAEALKLSSIVGAAGGIISMQPIPFADNVILTPMQIWLVVRIGQIYGQSMTQDAALKLLGTLGFGFAAQHATVALYKLIPGLTFGLGPFTVFGFTVLLGAMTALFYERGRAASNAERRVLLGGIKSLLRDRTFAQEIKDMGTEAFSTFKANGSKTRPEDFKAVIDTLSERAKPIGDRIERELFGKEAGDP